MVKTHHEEDFEWDVEALFVAEEIIQEDEVTSLIAIKGQKNIDEEGADFPLLEIKMMPYHSRLSEKDGNNSNEDDFTPYNDGYKIVLMNKGILSPHQKTYSSFNSSEWDFDYSYSYTELARLIVYADKAPIIIECKSYALTQAHGGGGYIKKEPNNSYEAKLKLVFRFEYSTKPDFMHPPFEIGSNRDGRRFELVMYEALQIKPLMPMQYEKQDMLIKSHDEVFEVKERKILFGFKLFLMKDPKIFKSVKKSMVNRYIVERDKNHQPLHLKTFNRCSA